MQIVLRLCICIDFLHTNESNSSLLRRKKCQHHDKQCRTIRYRKFIFLATRTYLNVSLLWLWIQTQETEGIVWWQDIINTKIWKVRLDQIGASLPSSSLELNPTDLIFCIFDTTVAMMLAWRLKYFSYTESSLLLSVRFCSTKFAQQKDLANLHDKNCST